MKAKVLKKFLHFLLGLAFLGFLIFFDSSAVAGSVPDQVVLLHTLRSSDAGIFFDPVANIENVFQRRFGRSGYRLKVVSFATGEDVQKELLNPENIAVFFVGHAGGGSSSSDQGVVSSSLIVDVNLRDISPIFSHVHPDLRVLSVVGCSAQKILERYQRSNQYPSGLQVISFQDLVDPQYHTLPRAKKNGLDRAITRAYPFLSEDLTYRQAFGQDDYCSQRYPRRWEDDPFTKHCRERAMEMRPVLRKNWVETPKVFDPGSVEVGQIKVIRHRQKENLKMEPALFFMGGIYLGFFPGGDLSTEEKTFPLLQKDVVRMQSKVIEIDSGAILIPKKGSVDMGYFEIQPSFPGKYEVEKSFDGSILGTTRHVYSLKP